MTRMGILSTTALLLSTIVASFAISECSLAVTRIRVCGINRSCWDLVQDTCVLLESTGWPTQALRYGHFSWFRSMSVEASVYQRSKDGGLYTVRLCFSDYWKFTLSIVAVVFAASTIIFPQRAY